MRPQYPGVRTDAKDTFRGEIFVMLSFSWLLVAAVVLFLLVSVFTAWIKVSEHLHRIKHDPHYEIGRPLYTSKLG